MQQALHILRLLAFSSHRFERGTELNLGAKKNVECTLDVLLSFPRKVPSLEPDVVDTNEFCAVARDHRKRRGIERQLRIRRGHHAFTHPGKLMHPCISAENGIVTDAHMTGEPGKTGNHTMRTNLAIVTNVGAIHDQVVIAHRRTATASRRADMHRHVLSDDVVAANLQTCGLVTRRLILGRTSETREGMNLAACTHPSSTRNDRVRPDHDAVRERNVAAHVGERAHVYGVGELRRRVYDRARVNCRHRGLNPFR